MAEGVLGARLQGCLQRTAREGQTRQETPRPAKHAKSHNRAVTTVLMLLYWCSDEAQGAERLLHCQYTTANSASHTTLMLGVPARVGQR